MKGNSSDTVLAQLAAHAEARFLRWHRGLREEFKAKLQALYSTKDASGQLLNASQRAWARLKLLEEIQGRQVRKQINIYRAVAIRYRKWEMFSKPRIDAFRTRIMTFVSTGCAALQQQNKNDAFAAGDTSRLPDPFSYQCLESVLLSIVNDELKVLQTRGQIEIDDDCVTAVRAGRQHGTSAPRNGPVIRSVPTPADYGLIEAELGGSMPVQRGRLGPKVARPVRAHRLKILKTYIKAETLNDMGNLARRAATTPTALYGMVREDRSRYSENKLNEVLNAIGCSRANWDQFPNQEVPL